MKSIVPTILLAHIILVLPTKQILGGNMNYKASYRTTIWSINWQNSPLFFSTQKKKERRRSNFLASCQGKHSWPLYSNFVNFYVDLWPHTLSFHNPHYFLAFLCPVPSMSQCLVIKMFWFFSLVVFKLSIAHACVLCK